MVILVTAAQRSILRLQSFLCFLECIVEKLEVEDDTEHVREQCSVYSLDSLLFVEKLTKYNIAGLLE